MEGQPPKKDVIWVLWYIYIHVYRFFLECFTYLLFVLIHLFGCRFTSKIWRLSLSYIIKRNRSETWNLPWFSTSSYHGKSNIQEVILGVYNHLLRKVFRFHCHSQKVIGSLGLLRSLWILGSLSVPISSQFLYVDQRGGFRADIQSEWLWFTINASRIQWCNLKMALPKRKLVFQPSIFRCYVYFREGNTCKMWIWEIL